ncbi:MAG: hypothetical protein J2P36_08345 [Ktedonobacteraceae bacterium]|nr:hypothetical protein [Ktedonobacteraceae bacterium]
MAEAYDVSEQSLGMTSRIGPLEIDWPRTIGYYGGIGLAWAFELFEPPLLLLIAAIPVLKMLNHPEAPKPTRFVGQLLEGVARPVGGSAEATIQLTETRSPTTHRTTILEEARQLAHHLRKRHARTTSGVSMKE